MTRAPIRKGAVIALRMTMARGVVVEEVGDASLPDGSIASGAGRIGTGPLVAGHRDLAGQGKSEVGHDHLEVGPGLAFFAGASQQVGGMIGGHEGYGLNARRAAMESVFVKPAAESAYRFAGAQQGLCGWRAECNDHFGVDNA